MSDKEADKVSIPESAHVACPMLKNMLRPMSTCGKCEHCRGLTDRFPGSSLPFGARYLVACAYPVGRTIVELEGLKNG